MNEQEALDLVDYHYWARDRILSAVEVLTPEEFLKDLGGSFKSVRDTVVHTYGAEWNWYLRWVGNSPSSLPVQIFTGRSVFTAFLNTADIIGAVSLPC
jgi:uncharacterized damage-inducible protein DinB